MINKEISQSLVKGQKTTMSNVQFLEFQQKFSNEKIYYLCIIVFCKICTENLFTEVHSYE
jgi:hypothetical protein